MLKAVVKSANERSRDQPVRDESEQTSGLDEARPARNSTGDPQRRGKQNPNEDALEPQWVLPHPISHLVTSNQTSTTGILDTNRTL
jgi:hypothetical protein